MQFSKSERGHEMWRQGAGGSLTWMPRRSISRLRRWLPREHLLDLPFQRLDLTLQGGHSALQRLSALPGQMSRYKGFQVTHRNFTPIGQREVSAEFLGMDPAPDRFVTHATALCCFHEVHIIHRTQLTFLFTFVPFSSLHFSRCLDICLGKNKVCCVRFEKRFSSVQTSVQVKAQ